MSVIVRYTLFKQVSKNTLNRFSQKNFSQIGATRVRRCSSSRPNIENARKTTSETPDQIENIEKDFAKEMEADDTKLYRRFSRINSKANFGYSTFGALVMIVYGLGMLMYLNKKERDLKESKAQLIRKQKHLSTIGGGINLIDTNGNRLTEKDFLGKWVMLYFGFTHCPDVCPDTLDRMVEIYNHLKESVPNEPVKMVFITVDPARDDSESIKEYLDDFHKDFVGLTGSNDEIKQVTDDFHVYFDAHKRGEEEDYLVDHTTLIYLLNPLWKFIDYFGPGTETPDVVDKIIQQMKYYKMPEYMSV